MSTLVKQSIAGVVPSSLGESTIMTVWPTAGAFALGRMLGQVYNWAPRNGPWHIVTLRNLVMLLTMPVMALLTIISLMPGINSCYRLTNRRIIIQRIWRRQELTSITLDQFDRIEVLVLPGQEWYPCGELVFSRGNVETFRLSGVGRPDTFAQTCMKAHLAHVGVKKALQQK